MLNSIYLQIAQAKYLNYNNSKYFSPSEQLSKYYL